MYQKVVGPKMNRCCRNAPRHLASNQCEELTRMYLNPSRKLALPEEYDDLREEKL